jgi:plasmid stabilization system protein ParE
VTRFLRFHPEAVAEAERSRDWYARRSPRAAQGFLDELSKAFASIQGSPEAWQAHLHGTRRFTFRRYPFVVVFRVEDESVLIVAVAHTKRKPGYWGDRVGESA